MQGYRIALRHARRIIFALSLLIFAAHLGLAQTPAPSESRTLAVNGMEIYYEAYGEGRPLVLLHGFGGSGAAWKPFIAEFAKHYRVIVPDLRGHGRSTNPSNRFTHHQSALDVYALLHQLKIDRFQGMGISTGGMTLIHMATAQPSHVEAMVLIGATIYFPEQARVIMRKSTMESLTAQEWERLRQIHKHGDEQIRALRNEFHNFKDSYDDMNFTPPFLSTITARTLIVHGDRDQFFPVEIPMEMYHSIPKSYLWLIPNGGHVPIVDRQAEFTQTALQFLRGDWEKNNSPR
ncbi:MAG: alpha/beta hydrolase [Acidobacteria bacterium]|nr:alpha/beta hydrolase [Acidobacteriota bacterium]